MSKPDLRLIMGGEHTSVTVLPAAELEPVDAPHFPAELIELTDALHDHGHVELGIMVLKQWERTRKLIEAARMLIDFDDGVS